MRSGAAWPGDKEALCGTFCCTGLVILKGLEPPLSKFSTSDRHQARCFVHAYSCASFVSFVCEEPQTCLKWAVRQSQPFHETQPLLPMRTKTEPTSRAAGATMFCVRSDVRSDEEKSAILSRGKGSPFFGGAVFGVAFWLKDLLAPNILWYLYPTYIMEYRVYPFGGGHDCPSAHHKANLQQQRFQNLVFDCF